MIWPYINMNPPRVYTCSQSWTPLPPPFPYHPSGSSQCTSPKHPISCIELRLVIHFLYDIIHVSMPFSQIIPPLPSPTESKRLFCTSVSLLLSHNQWTKFFFFLKNNQILELEGLKSCFFKADLFVRTVWHLQYKYSLVAQSIKNLHAMQESRIQFLGWEDLLEKEMTTHSSILAWEILQTEEPGRLQSMGSQSRTQLSD